MPELLDVAHLSKRGSSIRVTLPKRVLEILHVCGGNIVGFYEEDGQIILKKID